MSHEVVIAFSLRSLLQPLLHLKGREGRLRRPAMRTVKELELGVRLPQDIIGRITGKWGRRRSFHMVDLGFSGRVHVA